MANLFMYFCHDSSRSLPEREGFVVVIEFGGVNDISNDNVADAADTADVLFAAVTSCVRGVPLTLPKATTFACCVDCWDSGSAFFSSTICFNFAILARSSRSTYSFFSISFSCRLMSSGCAGNSFDSASENGCSTTLIGTGELLATNTQSSSTAVITAGLCRVADKLTLFVTVSGCAAAAAVDTRTTFCFVDSPVSSGCFAAAAVDEEAGGSLTCKLYDMFGGGWGTFGVEISLDTDGWLPKDAPPCSVAVVAHNGVLSAGLQAVALVRVWVGRTVTPCSDVTAVLDGPAAAILTSELDAIASDELAIAGAISLGRLQVAAYSQRRRSCLRLCEKSCPDECRT